MKTYKATMHFNKQGAAKGTPWTVHFRGACHIVKEIICLASMSSEWKPNKKSNPRAFFTADITSFQIVDGVAILKNENYM